MTDYDKLPTPIQAVYTQAQYAWLSDAEKARLVQLETEPDYDE